MKRKQSKTVFSIIAVAAFALMTGCASLPSAEFAADKVAADWMAEVKP